jgi:hypothetical protein
MAMTMMVAGNKEGDVDKKDNGNSNKGPTSQSRTTAKQQSTRGWQGLGWNSRGKAWWLIYTSRRGFGTTWHRCGAKLQLF